MKQKIKHKILRHTEKLVERYWPFYKDSPGGCMFWHTAFLLSVPRGIRCLVQAGTCYWPRLRRDQETNHEGVVLYGYQWNPTVAIEHISELVLPEIHVWAAFPDLDIIVDMTAGEFPGHCKNVIDLDWPGDRPPKVFWHEKGMVWPDRVVYKADITACQFALHCMKGIVMDLHREQKLAPFKFSMPTVLSSATT
jgi:hypothetical protein